MINAADLPNDIIALKALLLARDDTILGLEAQLNTRAAEIEHLLTIAKLRRMQFARKPEKLDNQIEQLELQLEDLQVDEAEAEREMPELDRAPRRKSVRRPLPDQLPRDEKIYAPRTEACPACGAGLRPLGEDVAEQLEYVPASFCVIRHVRPKLACSCCDAIVQAPAPSRPIERGIAGPGLLAHVLVAKYADHLPLYRQAVIYARDGVDLDRALLASWVWRQGGQNSPHTFQRQVAWPMIAERQRLSTPLHGISRQSLIDVRATQPTKQITSNAPLYCSDDRCFCLRANASAPSARPTKNNADEAGSGMVAPASANT